jgi:hypothetical protein
MCQYYKQMGKRFADGERYISLPPPPMEIEKAIGMFHVHGHQDSCFFRFATSFMKGAGMVDGEILETLWSTLNSISPSMRTASLAHRSEVLDDHMNDNNWKKMVSISEWILLFLSFLFFTPIARTIINKYNRAIKNVEESRHYFEDLSTVPTPEQIIQWDTEISEAEALRTHRPEEMDIMAPRIEKGQFITLYSLS